MTLLEKLAILKVLAWMASRDGEINESEIAFIEDVARQMDIDGLPPIQHLSQQANPDSLLHTLKSSDAIQTLLQRVIQLCFADGVYDARERASLMDIARRLKRQPIAVEAVEYELTESFSRALATLPEASQSKDWDWVKIAKIAGMTVAGGAALAATGGIAAPIIGGAIGFTFMGLSGAAAASAGLAFLGGGSLAAGGLGVAGGASLVATALGATGAATAAWKMQHRIGDIQEWDLEHIDGQGLHVCIGISGFLQEKSNVVDLWSALFENNPYAANYALRWESKAQEDLLKILSELSNKNIAGFGAANLALGAAKNAVGMAAIPLAVLSAMSLIDNPWHVAQDRSEQAGKILGDYIADGGFGGLPVTLAGYSLGTRVIIAALGRLKERDALGKIYDIYLMAGAVSRNDERLKSALDSIAGNLVNIYSDKDIVLQYVYRTAELFKMPIGTAPLELKGVVNIDVSDMVGGHRDYPGELDSILKTIRNELGYGHISDAEREKLSRKSQPTVVSNPGSTDLESIIQNLISSLKSVPGMTEASHQDFESLSLYLCYPGRLMLYTWKNVAGVDHIFLVNNDGQYLFAGYVGWVHSDGLKQTLKGFAKQCAKVGGQVFPLEL
jgi:hypothetical protein